MFILLPLLSFALLFLLLLEVQERSQQIPTGGIPAAFLKSAALLGGYMVFFSEILSLFHGLTRLGVALGWGIALLGVAAVGFRKGWIGAGAARLIQRLRTWRWNGWNISYGVLLGVILTLLFVVAIVSPPNNDDSLQYHMSRVMHWAEQGSLRHYAAVYTPALTLPINAELSILHVRLLWGNDKLANLIQWTSMVGSLIGIIGVTVLLGGKKTARWLAVAFAVSVPIGILEATSTQNDYVTAFWFVAFLLFVMLSMHRQLSRFENVCMGLTLGLGMLTKATFYFYAFPILIFFCVRLLIVASPRRRTFVELLVIGALAASLNLGHWSRNFVTFGSIFGPREFVDAHTSTLGPGSLLGGVVRNLAQNLGTPSEKANALLVEWLKKVFSPIDSTMQKFGLEFAWNHENLAGNPIHLFLASLGSLIVFFWKPCRSNRLLRTYTLLVAGSYLALGYTIYDFYGIRFQLPVFAAWAALFGLVAETFFRERKTWQGFVTILLFLLAFPWVLFNRTRPLIAMRESSAPLTIPCLASCTAESVLVASPTRTMFAGKTVLEEPYVQATEALKSSGCRAVGLYLDSHDFEYLFWWLLDAPQSGIHIESLHALPETKRYLDASFAPCAILCTLCRQGDQIKETFYGLDLASDYSGRVQLYLSREYWPGK